MVVELNKRWKNMLMKRININGGKGIERLTLRSDLYEWYGSGLAQLQSTKVTKKRGFSQKNSLQFFMKKLLPKFYEEKFFLFLVLTLLLASSSLALCLAYISQYIFGYQPCILCLYQRIPFFIIVFLSAIGLAIYRKIKIAKII